MGTTVGSRPFNAFAMAQGQFDRVADLLGLDAPTRALLRVPLREFHFSIPVRMDDGRVEVFRAFRIQHNDARGPCKGGIRFHPDETADSLRALAMWMSWKCAVADLPLGGSKGGVICDPHNLSQREQEQLCRGWVRQLARDVGPDRDVPAPDVMTNAQHMLWMLDEMETLSGGHRPGFITGKPVGMGGSLGRREATGFGLVFVLREALKVLGLRVGDTSASVQGFGNVAQNVVRLYHQIGGTVAAVSSWSQDDRTAFTYRRRTGVDPDELAAVTDRFGGIDRRRAEALGYEVLPGEAWISQDVDILVPAAIENQITAETVLGLSSRVRVIAEGANGPTSPEADEVLRGREVLVIPDLLANSGGVTCSYFEQVQSNTNYYWDRDEVVGKLDLKMTAAFTTVSELAHSQSLHMRDAAWMLAIGRVAQACRDRGWV